jgi:hypothetical protein
MRNVWLLALVACVGLLGTTTQAQAVILTPGMGAPVDGPGVLGPPNVASVAPQHFMFATDNGVVRGTYQEFVSSGRMGNPLGGLSFEYQITVTAGVSTDAVEAFTTGGFAGFATNVTFAPGGTVPVQFASRSAGSGDGISALFSNGGVNPGETSMWLIIDTNAQSFTDGFISLAGEGGAAPGLDSLSPAPEPATLTLALLGLPVLGAFGYRRLRRGKPA